MRRKQLLSDQIYLRLKQDIITCVIQPGEEIVQADLAARYNIGMTPVREALLRLGREGFVRSFPGFGYVVSAITPDDVREMYELRAILETATIRLAATRGDAEQLELIVQAAEFGYDYQDPQSYMDFVGKNRNFHVVIAQASGNQRLVELVSHVFEEAQRLFYLGLTAHDTGGEMLRRHRALAEAIRMRDADLAEQLVLDGIQRSQQIAVEGVARMAHRAEAALLNGAAQKYGEPAHAGK